MEIDLNCDMGESFGPWKMGLDEQMMEYITSANVAGGFHAGDPHVMRRTVELARDHGVAVGSHAGFPDLVGFGRREMNATPREVQDDVLYQLGALREFARFYGMDVQHVKPHGALYMMAARDEALSRAIIEAIQRVDPNLILFCMRASVTYDLACRMGQPVAAEFYADRGYNPDGTIVFTRGVDHEPDAEHVAARVVRAVKDGKVRADNGQDIDVEVSTVCVHGDTPGAVNFARVIVQRLRENNVDLKPIGQMLQTVS
jgi:5-oxoprolinase (ATP-hydrolysing) subunit A